MSVEHLVNSKYQAYTLAISPIAIWLFYKSP